MTADRARGEAGASLIIALAFLTLFGLMIPAILNLGSTNLKVTPRLGDQRSATYTADGATDAAIQYLRRHGGCGRPFGECPLGDSPGEVELHLSLNGMTAVVTITPLGGTFELNRTVQLETTVNESGARVTAEVYLFDSDTEHPGQQLPVNVRSWRYHR